MLDGTESLWSAPSRAMARKKSSAKTAAKHEEIPGQAERLKRLRKAMGYETAVAFANFLQLGITTYSAFENGSPLSRQAVFRMVQKIPGLSSDWLYFDRSDGLSVAMLRRLGEIDDPGKSKT